MYAYTVFFLTYVILRRRIPEKQIYIVSTTVLANTRFIMKKEESVKSFGTLSSLILAALNVLVLL